MKKAGWILCNLLAGLLASCSFGDEPALCPYNVKLEYWEAGSTVENALPVYVDNLRQYLFDGEGRQLAVTTLKGDSVTGWTGELEEGRYTLVVWGNLGSLEKSSVKVLPDAEKRVEDMTLSAERADVPPGYRENTERVYYATATLEVEKGKNLRQRVYLSHAHAALSVTVHWMADAPPPPEGGTYRMRLKGIPAVYDFTGGYVSDIPSGGGVFTIPRIGSAVTNHEARAAMNYDGEVNGQFVTFRYTSDTHQMWSLWRDGTQIIRDLDLNSFFSKLPIDMDTNMEQEFDILVTVYKDKIVVSLAAGSDWDEGGTIG
ncbi:FimB/Mfa2 family fimbrial subunit [Parabacteroides sp.]